MPEPKEGESRKDFLERCIPIVLDDGIAKDQKQAVAVCHSMWDESKKSTISISAANQNFADSLGKTVEQLSKEDKETALLKAAIEYAENNIKRVTKKEAEGGKSYAVKVLEQNDDIIKIGGYGVIYGGIDLEDETFDAGTDYMPELVPVKPIMYEHGLTQVKNFIGNSTLEEADEIGIWVEAQLDRHKEYIDAVLELIDEGVLGWSSGSVGHLVEREGKSIKRWPIVEYSLTPTPAEPRTLGVEKIKKLAKANPSLEALLPQEPGEGSSADATVDDESVATQFISIGDNKMADEKDKVNEQPEPKVEVTEVENTEHIPADGLKTLTGQVEELTEKMNALMQHMEDTPAIRKSGYYSVDGGKADEEVKSFGDFLKAIYRGDKERLHKVYETKAALAEGAGATGGFLVPEEYLNRLLQVAEEGALVRPRATVISVGSDAGKIPALDQDTAPTAGVGQTAFAGGVRAYYTGEEGAITETEPTFNQIEYNIKKMAGYSLVSNELIADSAQSVESLLYTLFGRAVSAMEDYSFLRGNGANEPLGVLNWGGLVNITPSTNNTFGATDAQAMLARFKPVGGSPVWAMHRGVIPDLADFTSYVGALFEPREAMVQGIYGYPIVFSEHLPQDNNSGDVILADFGGYLITDRQGMAIAFSEHYKFINDQGTWRFTKRLDGMPWLTGAITLADPQGSYTVAPFVNHND